jgi:hypothetical protein
LIFPENGLEYQVGSVIVANRGDLQ